MAIDTQSGSSSAALEARIAVLEELFVRLAQAGATESILDNGFKTIAERLETIAQQMMPLRALGPEEPTLTEDQDLRVRNLTAALVSPDWKAKPSPREQDSAASVQQMRSES
ncbi:hypothetical protein [Pararobbsia alpina]|uniref:Uncharacterized protein n=1 Tax=Pararobbsia alpina TaxID=621374 RepID=A0A6S7CT91_9BURK|nr:hypothetical protein [Pararobbsia alpina]CAB3787599.1 hypothetical protein LMG28138_02454 [Pararobbsia alpina]